MIVAAAVVREFYKITLKERTYRQIRRSRYHMSWTRLDELMWATEHVKKNILNSNALKASKQIFTWNGTVDYINKQIYMNVW